MRKIIVTQFMTLDGVVQALGTPDEAKYDDTSGDFKYSGWAEPYVAHPDTAASELIAKQLQPADLLLGRKTYEFFASYWPAHEDFWPGVNGVTKYVVSSDPVELPWQNSKLITGDDVAEQIKELKNSNGLDIQVHGSSNLIQALLKHDMVDELWLKIFPLTLGQGKKLFAEGTIAAAFALTSSLVASNGVIYANYERAGAITTGTVGS